MSWKDRVDELPASPGVYLFKSSGGRVLYVGKAQSLRARVRSYLGPGGDGRHQIPHLLERVADLDVLVTPSVKDALLLENELIKQHRPPFNVRLRDDKQYLGLRLDAREAWPRLQPVRRFREDGAQYFGPYTSSQALREAVSNLRRIFPLRSCSDATFKDYARRGRPCIEFEMRRCLAPCCGRIDEAAYAELVQGTALFLRGRSEELVRGLRERMEEAAREERFEEAARVRDRIAAVEQTVERQGIVGARGVNRDVFGLARSGGEVQVEVLYVRDGRVVGASDHGFSDVRLDDSDVMSSFLGQYYGDAEDRPLPGEVLTPVPVNDEGALEALLSERAGRKVGVHTPRRGALREIVAMASANAQLALARRVEARESVEAAAEELRERLALVRLPRRIECYDVSTLQGVLSVASRVVFEDGRPAKSGYRRYRIREAAGGDDYDCMREVLRRRFARVAQDPLPDLLMVDGGKGQLGVVTAALRDARLEVPAISLAKERDEGSPSPRVRRSGGLKAERVFVPGRKDPVLLSPSSRGLLLLQRVRDESHRFAIEFQRALRNRAGLTSVLQEIPGIGPAKRRALLKHLGSLRAVREASVEALAAVPGLSARDAETVRRFFDVASPPAGDAEASPPEGAV
ncbi:MAG TPA: excinuclease ABC subunit C [Deltaproteobacteria bacterium]|nr:excinuclease ABC subunit C [Deltaproteobacteria bacterium]